MVAIPLTELVPLSHYGGYPQLRIGTSLSQWWLSPLHIGYPSHMIVTTLLQSWYLSKTMILSPWHIRYLSHMMVTIPPAEWIPLYHNGGYPSQTVVGDSCRISDVRDGGT